MNIIESNKIIAEFMGMAVATTQNEYDKISHLPNASYLFNEDNLLYHKDWNWLMSVVEKINELDDLRFLVSINHQNCTIDSYDNGDEQMKGQANHTTTEPISINKHDHTTILSTYNAVIDFIKWYNQQFK